MPKTEKSFENLMQSSVQTIKSLREENSKLRQQIESKNVLIEKQEKSIENYTNFDNLVTATLLDNLQVFDETNICTQNENIVR